MEVEQLDNASDLLGFRPVEAADEPAEAEKDLSSQEPEIETESDEPGDNTLAADASGDEDEPVEGDDDSEDVGEEDLAAQLKALKAEMEIKEQQRRDWQSKATSSDADLGKVLATLENVTGKSKTQEVEPEESVLDRLRRLDPDEPVSAGTVIDLVKNIQGEQAKQTQQNQLGNFIKEVDQVMKSKPDFGETNEYFQHNNLAKDKEAPLLNGLGNYYRAKSMRLEEQAKKAFNEGKSVGAKDGVERKKRLNSLPPVSGRQSARESAPADPSGIYAKMMERRKARGIRSDGNF